MDRQQLTTRAGLGRLRDRVRSTLRTHRSANAESTEEDDPERASSATTAESDGTGNLFHCQRCGIVFIATEKETCSQCEVEVEQVRSTLSCR